MLAAAYLAACTFAIADDKTTDGKVFDLPGLHGTVAQIETQIHVELNDLRQKIDGAEAEIREADKDAAKHRAIVVAKLAKTDESYAYVCKTISTAERDYAVTTDPIRLEALSKKIEAFKTRKEEAETAAVGKDPNTPQFVAEREQRVADYDKLSAALEKAIKWRCDIGDAMRGSSAMKGPLSVGAEGIIGDAEIDKIDGDGTITARGKVFTEVEQAAGQREGIVTLSGHYDDMVFIISGMQAGTYHEGESTCLDQNFKVVKLDLSSDPPTAVVQRSATELDGLLHIFSEFRSATSQP